MIIGKAAPADARQRMDTFLHPLQAVSATRRKLEGRRVVVLVEGVYNGPNHRRLPLARPGDEIYVAGGDYAESLVRDGFVADFPREPVEEAPSAGEDVTPEPADTTALDAEDAPAGEPWRVLLEADLTEHLAQVVWEAGIRSREDVVQRYQDEGLSGLIAIHGVGAQTARRLIRWAGIKL